MRLRPPVYGARRAARSRYPMFETVAAAPLLVISASAGEGVALAQLIGALHAWFPALIVIVQARDLAHPDSGGEWGAHDLTLPLVPVADHALLQAGTVYLVPAHRRVQNTRGAGGPE